MPSTPKWIPIAKIVKDWGLRGHVKAVLFNPASEVLRKISQVHLELNGQQQAYAVEESKFHSGSWLLKFQGFENPEQAQSLRGATLLISREKLPPQKRGEIYLVDLEGASVLGPGGEALGQIQGFQKVGDSEVMLIGQNIQDAVMVPYESDFVAKTAVDEAKVYLKPAALDFFSL